MTIIVKRFVIIKKIISVDCAEIKIKINTNRKYPHYVFDSRE